MSMVDQDEEHLKLLSILYYVWGGLTAFGACFGSIYAVVGGGFLIAAASQQGGQNGPPPWFGAIFLVLGVFILALAVAISLLNIFTARFLARRQRYTFCFVVAVLSCLSVPLGTALGIFTIIVLQRPSVKAKFGQLPAPV